MKNKIIFMKKSILLIILTLITLFSYTQNLSFTNHSIISSGDDGYGRPRVALINDNYPVVIFRNNSIPKTIKIARWNGIDFDSAYDITNEGVNPSSQDGPEIAVKGDTIYIVFSSFATNYSSIMMIRSFDGGLSFSDTIRASENSPQQICRMGNIAINKHGHPVISYMKYSLNFTDPRQMVRTSNDYGATFNTAVEASLNASSEPCECCKSSLIVNNDNIFLLFRNNENNQRNSHIAKSNNNGISFDLVNDIDDFDWILNACPASTTNGVVYGDSLLIVKKSGATGNDEIVVTNVSQATLDYSYNVNVDYIPTVTQRLPEISNNNDSIFIVWEDNRHGTQDCFLSYSLNGIPNLSRGYSFTDSLSIGPKFFPDVTFKNGNIHLVYVDYNESCIKYVKGFFTTSTQIIEIENKDFKNINFDILGRKNRNSIFNFLNNFR